MRFAWLRQNSDDPTPIKQHYLHPLALIRFAYNLVSWIFLLPFVTTLDYSTGFIAFTLVIAVRLVLNLYVNFTFHSGPAQYERFPFRIP